MTLSQVTDLYEYWGKQPPTHVLVAAYLGVGGAEKQEEGDFGELLSMFGCEE